ncbi:MAG: sugar transferase [Paludibacteraceae bacterium]|nr:sugar transferase [Paludibacteraceae bacterium]
MVKHIKFILDRILALVGILLIWPFCVLIAVVLKLSDGGDVFFSQKRVGRNGELFDIYKFRTMTPDAEGSSVTVKGESRITPFGAFLRQYKLDEIPQLWNVLCGDMSFVGPRPDVPGYADLLQGEDRRILELLPGITGPASLKYRNEEELLASVEDPIVYNDTVIYPDKVRINLYYYHHYSLWMDAKIVMATLLNLPMTYHGERI